MMKNDDIDRLAMRGEIIDMMKEEMDGHVPPDMIEGMTAAFSQAMDAADEHRRKQNRSDIKFIIIYSSLLICAGLGLFTSSYYERWVEFGIWVLCAIMNASSIGWTLRGFLVRRHPSIYLLG